MLQSYNIGKKIILEKQKYLSPSFEWKSIIVE